MSPHAHDDGIDLLAMHLFGHVVDRLGRFIAEPPGGLSNAALSNVHDEGRFVNHAHIVANIALECKDRNPRPMPGTSRSTGTPVDQLLGSVERSAYKHYIIL